MLVTATARLKYVSIPPRKMRLVANMVKGLPVEKALDILNFTTRIAAEHIAKTLKSAAANALSQEGTANLRPESLCIKSILVDSAPSAKRIRFRAMGRADRYLKRHSHLTIILEENADLVAADDAAPAKGKGEKEPTKKAPSKKASAKKTSRKSGAPKPARGGGSKRSIVTEKKTTTKKTSTATKKV